MVDACDAEAVITSCLPHYRAACSTSGALASRVSATRTHAVAVVSSSLGSIIHDTVKPSPIVCRPSCAKALVAGRPARQSPPRRRTGSRASSTVLGAYKRAWSRIISDESRPWSTLWPRATAARAQRVGHRSRGQVWPSTGNEAKRSAGSATSLGTPRSGAGVVSRDAAWACIVGNLGVGAFISGGPSGAVDRQATVSPSGETEADDGERIQADAFIENGDGGERADLTCTTHTWNVSHMAWWVTLGNTIICLSVSLFYKSLPSHAVLFSLFTGPPFLHMLDIQPQILKIQDTTFEQRRCRDQAVTCRGC